MAERTLKHNFKASPWLAFALVSPIRTQGLCYNNLKPTAVVRRRNALAFENLSFRLRTLNHQNPALLCGYGFAAYKDCVFGFVI